jgi:hypothetical protein
MIDVFFSDDAQQARPYRDRMGSLVSTGCLHVPGEAVRDLEQRLENLCMESGFPKGRSGQFKWSPGRELWMYSNLKFEPRAEFFRKALALAAEASARVTVIVEDQTKGTATGAENHQFDVTKLLIERVEWRLNKAGKHGVIVVDRPAGDREDEAKFLASCLETISLGTPYVRPERIAFNVVSTPSYLVRCLQLADVIVSCCTAHVAGEDTWSPPIFDVIRPLLDQDDWRTGGVGLKVHPDFVYANLYHWLLGDRVWLKRGMGQRIPEAGMPYASERLFVAPIPIAAYRTPFR